MKKIIIFFGAFIILSATHSQEANPIGGGEFAFNPNKKACLTDTQRSEIIAELKANVISLKAENKLVSLSQRGNFPGFIWPVVKADGFYFNDIWGISGFMDHNMAYPNQLTDYDCGSRSYDTTSGYNHQGVDVFTWPFSWKMMDEDNAEVIAAASGQIIAKNDGEFDRSCNFNNNQWNAVYVMHSNGSVAWYGHLKNGSVTTKNVGDMVVEGEYLGVVGSSGNSTGPHLHFEIWEDNTYNNLIDPYAGGCNSTITTSWWQNQKPYRDSKINAVLTHTSPPDYGTCPEQEVTNESTQFDPNQTIYFATYLRDQVAGQNMTLRIIRPDNTVFNEWSTTFTNTYSASWWYWTNSGLDIEGEWKWQATYEGETITHTFNIGTLSVSDHNFESLKIFPNPFKDEISISSNSIINSAVIIDVLGKRVLEIKEESKNIEQINTSNLAKGVYFLTLRTVLNQSKTIKLIKE